MAAGSAETEVKGQGLKEARQISWCQEMVPTECIRCADWPWAASCTTPWEQSSGGHGEKAEERVLGPHRHEESNLFTLRPSGHTRELPWSGISRHLGSARVRLPKGQKEKGERGKDSSEG